jgi:hypothetical protein
MGINEREMGARGTTMKPEELSALMAKAVERAVAQRLNQIEARQSKTMRIGTMGGIAPTVRIGSMGG